MTQAINVLGVGTLQFPDGMSQPDMAAAIQKNYPQIHQPAAAAQKPAEPSLAMAPVGGAELLGSAVTGGLASIPAALAYAGTAVGKAAGLTEADPADVQRRTQDYFTYQPQTQSGKAGAALLGRGAKAVIAPVAKLADQAATQIGKVSPTTETYLRAAPAAAQAAGALVPGVSLAKIGINAMREAAPAAAAAPTKQALKEAARAAYKRSEDAGVVIAPESLQKAQQSIGTMLEKEGLDPTLHPATTAALKRIAASEGPVTLEKLETLRKIAQSAQSTINPADKRLASKTVEALDDYADSLGKDDLLAGTPDAVNALTEARDYWSRARKADTIDELTNRAELSAANFSGSGMENALRTEFRNLAKNQRKIKRFSPEEQDAIRRVAQGGPMENALRMVGKFAPTGSVSTAISAGGGFMAGGPLGAVALPVTGMAARKLATRMTANNARKANELMRRGPLGSIGKNP